MKTYSKMELDHIIADHKKWLEGCAGGSMADLSSANLRYANLSSANLSYADLSYADLSYADLSSANLRSANLRYANLSSANLSSANLRYAEYMDIKIADARFVSGLYKYICAAVVDTNGTPYVRMGCLWYSVEDWDRITIRNSNPSEFPNNGSETSEQRARAFEFMRNEALIMASKFKLQPERDAKGRLTKKEK